MIDIKTLWKTRKKMILSITAGVTAAAIGCGIWYQVGHTRSDPVYVYPFSFVGMTEYWGDSQESGGSVTTDKIQTVFVSDTQTVTKILVKEGDRVQKGDLLMTFDTTLSDLQVEKKRLDVEKKKLQLGDAKRQLANINSMKPMEVPTPDDSSSGDTNLGFVLRDPYRISEQKSYDGSSAETALICWIRSDTAIGGSLFNALRDRASYYQFLNAAEETEPTEPSETTEPTETDPTETDPTTAPTTEPTTAPTTEPPATEGPDPGTGGEGGGSEGGEGSEQSSASAVSYPQVGAFHVVFRVTGENMSLGEKLIWQGFYVLSDNSFQLESAVIPDHMVMDFGNDDSEDVETPDIDFGSGYTAAQIAQMRSDQLKKIKDLELQIKLAEAEYKIMQAELSDGHIYAQVDGKISTLISEEEAKKTKQPILKLSGGGGYYVEATISELDRDKIQIGQEVTVNDWSSGMMYVGTVQSIGDFPSQDNYYGGNGNPNATQYPFRIFVDEDADLRAGSYVSVNYSAAESENGIYLENPFLRTENGVSFVYVLGKDGKLERRDVRTGKSLWGSYTEIRSGLTADDLVAFPYGKNVRPGVAAQEGDISNLYNY